MFHKPSVLLACSGGGHLVQLLRLADVIGKNRRLVLLTEGNEVNTSSKFSAFSDVCFIPHGGRENGFIYIFMFMRNFFLSLYYYLKFRPKILVSNGAHTALPICLIAKVFRTKIIFIETFAKVSTPTITGRVVYHFADVFYVQWPQLKEFYKEARYEGKLY